MDNIKLIIVLVVLALALKWVMNSTTEGFHGTMPQDIRLTVNTEKYTSPYYGSNPYDRYIWNNPTRYNSPYYYYDYRDHIFPYVYYYWGY